MAIGTGAAILGASAIGALAGKKSGNTQSTSSSEPWGPQQGSLKSIYDQANNIYYGSAAAPWQTGHAQNLQANRAMAGSPLNQAAQQQNLSTLQGDYLNAATNPGLQSAMDSARTKINAQFSGDNYGNSAHQEWLSKGLMDAAAPFYEGERQRQMGASALAPTLANQDYTDISQLGAVGAQKRAEPWDHLFNFQRAVSGSQGGTQTTQQPYFTNPLATGLGMGLGGLGMYNMMNQGGLLGGGSSQPMYTGYGMQGDYQYG